MYPAMATYPVVQTARPGVGVWLDPLDIWTPGVNVKWGPSKMGTLGPQKHWENGDPPVKMGTPPTGNLIRERSSSVVVWNCSMP